MATYNLIGNKISYDGSPYDTNNLRYYFKAKATVVVTDYPDHIEGYVDCYVACWFNSTSVSQSMSQTGTYSLSVIGTPYSENKTYYWYSKNQETNATALSRKTFRVNKTYSAQTANISISFYSNDLSSTSSASVSISVPAKTSYTITYNMNGGVGTIANQTKWYNETLTLSPTIPTREGYIFRGWATTSTATSPEYNAGGTYSANSGNTLYAVWHQNPSCTYQVTTIDPYYNGGKNYSVKITEITLYDSSTLSKLRLDFGTQSQESSVAPTTNSPTILNIQPAVVGTISPLLTIIDSLGATSTFSLNNVIVKQYIPPIIQLSSERVKSNGVPSEADTGSDLPTYSLITMSFNIPCYDYYPLNSAPTINFANTDTNTHNITWYSTRNSTTKVVSGSVNWSTIQTNDVVYALIDNCDLNSSYTFYITPHDSRSNGMTKSTITLQMFYTLDFLAGGHGIAFGGPATQEGFVCNMPAAFRQGATGIIELIRW